MRSQRNRERGRCDGCFLRNGSKTFIRNGWHANRMIVEGKTQPVAAFQNTRYKLARMQTEARVSADKCCEQVNVNKLDTATTTASMAQYWCSVLHTFGGTTEIMKEVIARGMWLGGGERR